MPLEIFENFSQDVFGFAMSAYDNTDPWFWPLFFLGIVGFVYGLTGSVVAAGAGIIIILGTFGSSTSIFADMPEITQLFYIIVIIGIAMLMTVLFVKARQHT